MLLMYWCLNVRNHTLITESLVPMHGYPEIEGNRESNHFLIL
jgi:hypothetical protein